MSNNLISTKVKHPQSEQGRGFLLGFFVLALFLLSASSVSAAELKRPPNNLGLVDYFPMDEGTGATTVNKSRVGTAGTITGATWVAGKKEQALDFNANGSYMTYSCGANCVNYPYTVSLWFNADTLSGLLFGVNNGFNNSIAFTGGTYLHMSGNSNYMRGALTSNFQTGRWYNMTAVYTSSTDMKMYVNGVEQTVATDDWWTLQCANIYSIGSRNGGACASSLSFDGRIDDVRLYNRALSAADITNLYQLSFTKFNSSQNNKVTNGLVGLWSFDGADMSGVTAYDRSGQGNNGTLTNGPTRTIGKVGQGISFDGVNDEITTTTNQGNGSSVKVFTISAWFKTSTASGKKIIGLENNQTGTDSNSYDRQLYVGTDGKVYFYVYDGSGKLAVSSSTFIDNNWHHAVGVSSGDGGSIKLYVDGVLQQTTAVGTIYALYGTSYWRIGGYKSPAVMGVNGYFPGSLDDVRIYDRALTQSEITQLYNAGGAKINASQNNIPGSTLQSGLVGLWSFNGPDMSGVTAYDRSGQGNNGTLTNGPTRTIGKVGQGLNFDGVNDYVDAGNGSSLTNMTAMSIVSWIRPSTFATHNQGAIIYKNWYFATCRVGCGVNNVLKFNMSFDGAGNATWISPVNSIKLDEWQQVVVTYDRSSTLNNPIFYINGVSTSSTQILPPVGAAVSDAAGSLYLGLDTNLSWLFSGSLDEVRIYNRILSVAEVKQLYLLGR